MRQRVPQGSYGTGPQPGQVQLLVFPNRTAALTQHFIAAGSSHLHAVFSVGFLVQNSFYEDAALLFFYPYATSTHVRTAAQPVAVLRRRSNLRLSALLRESMAAACEYLRQRQRCFNEMQCT